MIKKFRPSFFGLAFLVALAAAYATPIETFDLAASRLLIDPARGYLYASLTEDNAVAVIDIGSLTVIQTITVGSRPVGMTLSPDGTKLYVALSGATSLSVIETATLKTLPSLPIEEQASEVEAGLGNRLYLGPQFLQVDAATGASQPTPTISGSPYGASFIEISPDRTFLLIGNSGISPSSLYKFDVSAPEAVLDQAASSGRNGSNGQDLTISHNGQFFCYPNASNSVPLIPTSNVNATKGTFIVDYFAGPVAFSPDDVVAYVSSDGLETTIRAFSTRRYLRLFELETSAGYDALSDLATDPSGRYLFAAEPSAIQVYDLSTKLVPPLLANLGEAFSYQVAFDFPVTSYTANDLSEGLTINSDTGLIFGTPLESGAFSVLVTATNGTMSESREVSLNIFPDSRALNISTRLEVGIGDDVLIAGFIIQGNPDKNVVLRALGPSLATAGQPVPGSLTNPTLELHDGAGATIASNDDWENDSRAGQLTALGIAPTEPKEAALYRTLSPGAYTAIVRGVGGATGVGLVELYDVDTGQLARLANISTRGNVGTEDQVMIGGFIVGGPDDARVLVRAIGPSLAAKGIAGTLSDPQLDLFDAEGAKIASNDDWRETQEDAILETGVAPFNDHESAILQTLAPGACTAIVSGVAQTTGVALVEAYNLP